MTPAFWDASALVPLCVRQQPSQKVRRLLKQHQIVVWWSTSVEMRSAFERLLRMGQLTAAEAAVAGSRLAELRQGWREIQPSESLRSHAEKLLTNFSLKAADALQLSAAWMWTSGAPQNRVFIAGDEQLAEAARQTGFQIVVA